MLLLRNDMSCDIDTPCLVSHWRHAIFVSISEWHRDLYVALLYKVKVIHMGHVWKTNVVYHLPKLWNVYKSLSYSSMDIVLYLTSAIDTISKSPKSKYKSKTPLLDKSFEINVLILLFKCENKNIHWGINIYAKKKIANLEFVPRKLGSNQDRSRIFTFYTHCCIILTIIIL